MSGGHEGDGPGAFDKELDALEAGATPTERNEGKMAMSFEGRDKEAPSSRPSSSPLMALKAFSQSFQSPGSAVDTSMHSPSPTGAVPKAPKSALKKAAGSTDMDKSFEELVAKKKAQNPEGVQVTKLIKRGLGLGTGTTRRPSAEGNDIKLAEGSMDTPGVGDGKAAGGLSIGRFLSKKTISKTSIKSFAGSEEGGGATPLQMPRTKSTAQAVSYLRKARALEAKGAKALDPTQLDETSNWVKMHEFAVKDAADKQTKQGSGMQRKAARGAHVSAVSGKVTTAERARLRRIEQATALAGYAGKGDTGNPNTSSPSVVSIDDEEGLEDEEFMLNEVDTQLALDRENYTDSVVSIMRDLCKGSRFVVAELWSLPSKPKKSKDQHEDVDENGNPVANWGRPGPDNQTRGTEESHDEDLDSGTYTNTPMSPDGHSHLQSGLSSQPSSTRHDRGGGRQRRGSMGLPFGSGTPFLSGGSEDASGLGNAQMNSLPGTGGVRSGGGGGTWGQALAPTPTRSNMVAGGINSMPLQRANSTLTAGTVTPAFPSLPHAMSMRGPSAAPMGREGGRRSSASAGHLSYPEQRSFEGKEMKRESHRSHEGASTVSSMPGNTPQVNLAKMASGDGEARHLGEEGNVESMRSKTRIREFQGRGRSSQVFGNVMGGAVKGMKRAIKASNIVRTSERLCYTGRRYVQERFYELPKSKQSVYHQKKIDVGEGLKNLDDKAKMNQYDVGEGLPGECWLRNDLDWNLLETLRDDPERPPDAHLQAAAYLFHASIAIPIFDIAKPHPLVAVIIMYTPHEHGDPRIHEYLDPKQNPEVGIFLKQMSVTMPLALRWMHTKDQWEKEYRSFVEDPKQHARRMWRVLRIVVSTGWLRICKSDKTPKNPCSRALFKINNLLLPRLQNYLEKWKGLHLPPPPRGDWSWSVQSFFGSVVGLGVLGGAHFHFNPPMESGFPSDEGNIVLLIASFAAVICLIFAAPTSPYAQPRMVIGGHIVSVSVAIIMNYFTKPELTDFTSEAWPTAFLPYWLSVAITPSIAIAMMTAIGVVHPPAAACCLIFITAGDQIKELGWLFLAMPTLTGCCLLILVGLIFNNMFSNRKYPMFW